MSSSNAISVGSGNTTFCHHDRARKSITTNNSSEKKQWHQPSAHEISPPSRCHCHIHHHQSVMIQQQDTASSSRENRRCPNRPPPLPLLGLPPSPQHSTLEGDDNGEHGKRCTRYLLCLCCRRFAPED
mmetsp:Transcript_3226/g.5885  ORF Transcript_3226/g.5885 Transcript_3226/m.5885 type:complete len:128 (+) Transcript_3226:279-662(+)